MKEPNWNRLERIRDQYFFDRYEQDINDRDDDLDEKEIDE